MAEYRLLKDKGNNATVTLENVDRKTSVILGKLTMEMLDILETDEGFVFERDDEEGSINLKNPWCLTITEETAKKLSTKAMPIHKPKRDQSKKAQTVTEEKPKQVIDAMDVLLGLASYN